MRRAFLMCVLLSACGGNPVVGTWRSTSTVTIQSPSGTSMRTIVTDFVITPAAWVVGGGCEAPLSFNGPVAHITTLNQRCTLTSKDGLPFADLVNYEVGKVLVIRSGRFEAVMSKLELGFSLKMEPDPGNPDTGDVVDFQSKPGMGADRLR